MASARAYKLPDTKYKFAPLEYDHSAIDDDKAKAAVGWLVKGLHTLQQSPMASAIFVGLVTEKEIDPAVQVHAYRTAPSGVAQESYALDTDWETQFEKGMLSSDTSDTEDDEDGLDKLNEVSQWLYPMMIHGVYRCEIGRAHI